MRDDQTIEGVRFLLLPGNWTPERQSGQQTNGRSILWWYDAGRNRWRVCPERRLFGPNGAREHLEHFGRTVCEEIWRTGWSIDEYTNGACDA